MKRLLLDTHVFIWWASEPERLSDKVLALCENRDNILMLAKIPISKNIRQK